MTVNYPLATSSWNDREVAALRRVIDSGQFTMGSEVARFERNVAEYLGVRHCVMVNSGSSANLLMVAALFFRRESPLRAGDTVIVPAVSWATTYYPLQQYGLRLRFVDIDLQTLNYDNAALAAAIDDDVRVVVAVNILGNPNDFTAIRAAIGTRPIVLIEDNCEALGARFEGQLTGTFGLMGSYSTYFSHHMSTMEGGLISTDDDELHQILVCLRAHGWTRELPAINYVTGEKDPDPFMETFRFVLPGYNVRPLEMQGAVGVEQLAKLPGMISQRRANATVFASLFAGHDHFIVQREVGESSWFGFSLVIRPEADVDRATIVARLRSAEIECRPIVAGNFVSNPVMRYVDYDVAGALDNASHVDRAGLFVGNNEQDLRREIEALAGALSF